MPRVTASTSFDTVFKSIRKGEFPAALYLHGPEDLLKDELIGELIERALDPSTKDFNFDLRSAATLEPEEVDTICRTLPMMADRRVTIIRDVEAWTKKAMARGAVLQYLERPVPETVLVLVQGGSQEEPDPELVSRTTSISAEPLPPSRALKWLQLQAQKRGLELDETAADHMVRATDGNLSVLRTELEKLAGLSGGAPISRDRVAEFLGVRHGETQYDWRDLILSGRGGQAAALIPHVMSQTGVSGVSLVSLVGSSLIGLGLARSYYDRGERGFPLIKSIKNSLFRARAGRMNYDAAAVEWSNLVAQWPRDRIEAGLRATLKADERLKSTTVSDPEAIIFDLCMELVL